MKHYKVTGTFHIETTLLLEADSPEIAEARMGQLLLQATVEYPLDKNEEFIDETSIDVGSLVEIEEV